MRVERVEKDEACQLQARLERALRGRPIEAFLPRARALAGFDAVVDASLDQEQARLAVQKLLAGARLLPAEIEVLETGIRLARPALRVETEVLPRAPAVRLDEAARASIEAMLPGVASVGRDWHSAFATAFQVAPRVLVTNEHVTRRLLQDPEGLAQGRFVAHFGACSRPGKSTVPILRVLETHPREDVALIELVSEGPLSHGLRLAWEPALRREEEVLVVGYPIYNLGNPPWVDELFENLYGVMRASPGEVLGGEANKLYHDCTTLPGSSGSPVFGMKTGLVVGIHSSGQFAYRNTAVSTRALREEVRMRDCVSTWIR